MGATPMLALGDVCAIYGGGTPATDRPDFYDGNIPWITVRDMSVDMINATERNITQAGLTGSSASLVPSGNVVIASRVGLGKVCRTNVTAAINQDLKAIIPRDAHQLDVGYLYWWLRSAAPKIVAEGRGATVLGVKLDFLRRLLIPIPPLPEQQRVAAILDEAFAGIAKATANAERNLANAREFFRAILDQRFLLAPAYWHRRTLGTVCAFSGGSQPPKSEFSKIAKSGYVRLIQIRDYKSDDHIVFVDKNSVSKFCDASDVMIGRYGPPLFQILRGIEGAYNVALMKATPTESILSKDYLYYFLKNSHILNHIIQHSDRAAGQTGIKREVLEAYEICFPGLEEQAGIVRQFGELEKLTRKLAACYEMKLREFSALKQGILHKAFSGQLTGKDAIAA